MRRLGRLRAMPPLDTGVPSALRRWFVVHFAADLLFALPMFIAPVPFLRLFGWVHVDPIATRLVAAALFGIGIQSLLGRNEDRDTYRAMLTLKVIWSSTATLGIVWSIGQGASPMAWLFAAILGSFSGLWSYYRLQLSR
jgi:hypothetical protein